MYTVLSEVVVEAAVVSVSGQVVALDQTLDTLLNKLYIHTCVSVYMSIKRLVYSTYINTVHSKTSI